MEDTFRVIGLEVHGEQAEEVVLGTNLTEEESFDLEESYKDSWPIAATRREVEVK